MTFADRTDAGRQLAVALEKFASKRPVVLALPAGGVAVGAEVARALDAPLDLIMVQKMHSGSDPDVAIGAIADRGEPMIIWNPWALKAKRVSRREREAICDAALESLSRRRRRYLDGVMPLNLTGEAVILIDDGLATGASMKAAIKAVRAEDPALLVVAVPVASEYVLAGLAEGADAVVCVEPVDHLSSVSRYYDWFPVVDDDAVAVLLEANRRGK